MLSCAMGSPILHCVQLRLQGDRRSPLGKGRFPPLPCVKPQPVLSGFSDSCQLFNWCKSGKPIVTPGDWGGGGGVRIWQRPAPLILSLLCPICPILPKNAPYPPPHHPPGQYDHSCLARSYLLRPVLLADAVLAGWHRPLSQCCRPTNSCKLALWPVGDTLSQHRDGSAGSS